MKKPGLFKVANRTGGYVAVRLVRTKKRVGLLKSRNIVEEKSEDSKSIFFKWPEVTGKNLMDPDRQVFALFIEIKRTVQLWSKSKELLQSEVELGSRS